MNQKSVANLELGVVVVELHVAPRAELAAQEELEGPGHGVLGALQQAELSVVWRGEEAHADRCYDELVRDTVRQLALASELVGTIDPNDIAPRKCSASIPSDDVHVGVVTAEPGRRCTDCAYAPDGLGCGNFNVSLLMSPQINVLRRCKGFKPRYGSYDDRGASQLWPELWTTTEATK